MTHPQVGETGTVPAIHELPQGGIKSRSAAPLSFAYLSGLDCHSDGCERLT
jgi:hypothetical protein